MVAWNKAKGKAPGNNDRKDIVRMVLDNGDNKVRLIGDVLPRYVYWVTTTEGKKIPVECLKFNRQTETFDNSAEDPFDEIDEAVYNDKPSFAYVCNLIDRKDKTVKIFDLRATIYGQIVDYATNAEYGNPADEDVGYDITIKKEKTGPLPQNVKYTVVPARSNSPLSDEDKELAKDMFDLNAIMKRQTYAEQKEWLIKNTAYFAGEIASEFQAAEGEEAEDLA